MGAGAARGGLAGALARRGSVAAPPGLRRACSQAGARKNEPEPRLGSRTGDRRDGEGSPYGEPLPRAARGIFPRHFAVSPVRYRSDDAGHVTRPGITAPCPMDPRAPLRPRRQLAGGEERQNTSFVLFRSSLARAVEVRRGRGLANPYGSFCQDGAVLELRWRNPPFGKNRTLPPRSFAPLAFTHRHSDPLPEALAGIAGRVHFGSHKDTKRAARAAGNPLGMPCSRFTGRLRRGRHHLCVFV